METRETKPKINIIIPTYNKLEQCLKPCIESIFKHTVAENVNFVVVANGCTDGTHEYLTEKRIHFIQFDDPLGFSKAVNAGINHDRTADYYIILNNDTILQDQSPDTWLNMLLEPFLQDESVGITGPIRNWSPEANHDFIIFFCVMISKKVIDAIGLLDESFGVGGGEDTDYCIRAKRAGFKYVQVPNETPLQPGDGRMIGTFPIFHDGEATVHDKSLVPNYHEVYKENGDKLRAMYNDQFNYGNNFERAVLGKNHDIPPAENARYEWARREIYGHSIAEIGCSAGYGYRYFGSFPGCKYSGFDNDSDIIKYAIENYGEYFSVLDVHDFSGEYDTIIAMEVIEHCEDGKELAQKLKQYCRKLIITVPFNEVPGLWGPHHKLHRLQPKDFPDFKYCFIHRDGLISDTPNSFEGYDCIGMVWEKGSSYKQIDYIKEPVTVGVEISTKGRYFDSLPMAIMGIINQTMKPQSLTVYDDNDSPTDLRTVAIYQNIFNTLSLNGINWRILYGNKSGQVANHQRALSEITEKYIWRIDDDEIPNHDCLQYLMETITKDNNIGAVGPLVWNPINPILPLPEFALSRLEPSIEHTPVQWYSFDGIREVEHLHSTFLFNRIAGKELGYPAGLSVVGHREETMFTYGFILNGFRLLVDSRAKTLHFQNKDGGIRSENKADLWNHDESVFREFLKSIGREPKGDKLMVLNSGLGDSIVAIPVIGEVLEKYKKIEIKVLVSQKSVIPIILERYGKNPRLKVYHSAGVETILNPEAFNIYGYMPSRGWKNKPLIEAYREFYL
jgi:GT2 family glycosyltransferase